MTMLKSNNVYDTQKMIPQKMENVQYVVGLKHNLLIINQLCDVEEKHT